MSKTTEVCLKEIEILKWKHSIAFMKTEQNKTKVFKLKFKKTKKALV